MTTSECNFGMSLSDVDDESLDNSTDDPDFVPGHDVSGDDTDSSSEQRPKAKVHQQTTTLMKQTKYHIMS